MADIRIFSIWRFFASFGHTCGRRATNNSAQSLMPSGCPHIPGAFCLLFCRLVAARRPENNSAYRSFSVYRQPNLKHTIGDFESIKNKISSLHTGMKDYEVNKQSFCFCWSKPPTSSGFNEIRLRARCCCGQGYHLVVADLRSTEEVKACVTGCSRGLLHISV